MSQEFAVMVEDMAIRLDEVKPGWATLIETDRLDIEDPDRCVLGQVFEFEASEYGDESYADGYDYAIHHNFAGEVWNPAFNDNATLSYWLIEIRTRVAASYTE